MQHAVPTLSALAELFIFSFFYICRFRAYIENSHFTIFSFLKFNEFHEFFSIKKIRQKFVILQIIDV